MDISPLLKAAVKLGPDLLRAINPSVGVILVDERLPTLLAISVAGPLLFASMFLAMHLLERRFGNGIEPFLGAMLIFLLVMFFLGEATEAYRKAPWAAEAGTYVLLVVAGLTRVLDGFIAVSSIGVSYADRQSRLLMSLPYLGFALCSVLFLQTLWRRTDLTVVSMGCLGYSAVTMLLCFIGLAKLFQRFGPRINEMVSMAAMGSMLLQIALYVLVFLSFLVSVEGQSFAVRLAYYSALPAGLVWGFYGTHRIERSARGGRSEQ